MKVFKVFSQIRKPVWILFLILSHVLILRNIFYLSKDILYGDSSGEKTIPLPRYRFMRLPDNPLTRQYHAVNGLGADFAQIYFPSQQFSSLSQNYQMGEQDPWQWRRSSRYAPAVHFLCSITLCKLDYGAAGLFHLLIQMALFYAFFIWAFRTLNIRSDVWKGLALVDICLFLTPAGLSWFERGQLSLYVAVSYLLVIIGFMKKNYFIMILSALFAFMKWTSFSTLFVILTVLIIQSKDCTETKQNLRLISAFILVIASLSLCFPVQSAHFLGGLYHQERFVKPEGISLGTWIPVKLAKGLPIALILLGAVYVKKGIRGLNALIPFFIGTAMIMLLYPTISYDYNISCLLGLIPPILYWMKLRDNPIDHRMRLAMKYSFLLFLMLGSASYLAYWLFHARHIVVYEYLVFSSIFLFIPLFYAGQRRSP